jgi:hypothetical protein
VANSDLAVIKSFSICSPENLRVARAELNEILDAGARALKGPGLELLPIKRDMLRLTDEQAHLILDACNLLFAAILSYEAALWDIKTAPNAVALVNARIEAGKAEGVVNALFFGPTVELLLTAMNHAPIAFYAMSEASPALHIIQRCQNALNSQRNFPT